MLIEVAMLPAMLGDPRGRVCIMVDVLRASTSLTVLLECGVREIRLARDVEAGAMLAAQLPGSLLVGERGGLPPPGFDYGNSPVMLAEAPVAGRRVVFCTSNGTRALARLRGATAVLVGALINATAVARAAVDLAQARGAGITIVCAGRALGRSFGLDDLYVAGCLVMQIGELMGAAEIPTTPNAAAVISGGDVRIAQPALDESALAAMRLFTSYGGDHSRALAESGNGRALRALGLSADVEYCAVPDRSATVGRVRYRRDGMGLESA